MLTKCLKRKKQAQNSENIKERKWVENCGIKRKTDERNDWMLLKVIKPTEGHQKLQFCTTKVDTFSCQKDQFKGDYIFMGILEGL